MTYRVTFKKWVEMANKFAVATADFTCKTYAVGHAGEVTFYIDGPPIGEGDEAYVPEIPVCTIPPGALIFIELVPDQVVGSALIG